MYGSTYDEPATTRVPSGEVDYLAKAAEQLDRLAADVDTKERQYGVGSYRENRKELADRYAQLGAIQRGQMPAELARLMFEQLNKGH